MEDSMATIQFADGFGLNVSITPAKGPLSKYFQNFPHFSVLKTDLEQISDEDLTNPAITKIQSGLRLRFCVSCLINS
jgi:hypothetical protein